MRSTLGALALAFTFTVTAHAQLHPLPSPSANDGILVLPPGLNSGWQTTALADYRVDGGNPFFAPLPGNVDSHGRLWGEDAPDCALVKQGGGTLRAIFLGSPTASAGGVGYCYSFTPLNPDAYTLGAFNDESAGNLAFGDYADFALAPNDATSFDFWLSSSSGTYTLLNPLYRAPGANSHARVLWTQQPLLVATYLPVLGGEALVQTWVVNVSEEIDGVRQDYRIALQQFPNQGGPLVPIPEPATYAGVAAALCAGLAAFRMRRGKR